MFKLLLLTTLLVTTTLTSPLPSTSKPLPAYNPFLSRRVSAAAFADWPTNFIFQSGSQQLGGWLQPDGIWRDLDDVQCLDLPAYAIGACSAATVDSIGVAVGNGPCSFVGANGWTATVSGAAGSGWTPVGPPQTLIRAVCG